MRIYLDESKKIWNGQIVIWGFITFHNTQFIEKFVKNKKLDFLIPDNVELKSINKYWRLFSEKVSWDGEFDKLQVLTFGFYFENYFVESDEWYTNLLLDVLLRVLNFMQPSKWEKVNVFHDNLNAQNNSKVEKKIDQVLSGRFGVKSHFKIHNSKNFLGLQLADLIVWKYKEFYFFNDVNTLDKLINKKDWKNKKT